MRRWLALGIVPGLCSGCLWISAAEHAQRLDGDADGALADVDCDDADPAVSPDLPELPCDGVDNDCDPATPDGPAFVQLSPSQTSTFASVQQAIDASVPPQQVVVCGAAVREAVVLDRPGLSLTGLPGAGLDGAGGDGPVITVTAPDVTIADLAVTGGAGLALAPFDGPAGRYGGGVCAMESAGRVTLRGVSVTGSTADYGGGVAGLDLVLEGCDLSANTAGSGGGLWVGGTATVTGSTLSGNTAEDGGGIDLAPGATATLDGDTAVRGNTAARGGGVRLGVGAVLTGGLLEANAAGEAGGGVLLDEATLVSVEVRDNEAPLGGGVSGWGRLERVTVSGNVAEEGGGVHADGDVTAVLGLFSSNIATVAGGGVLVTGGRFAVDYDPAGVERPRFLANHADGGWGGGIAVLGGELEVAHTDLIDNHARYGGAVAVRDVRPCLDPCLARIADSTVDANSASEEGGGVWSDRPLTIERTPITQNASDGVAGALFLAAGGTLDGVTFDGNEAGTDGGAVLIARGEVTLDASSFALNGALGRGAAVMLRPVAPDTAKLTVTATDLRQNHAISSAAVALTPADATLVVAGGTWSENTDFDIEVGGSGCFVGQAEFTCGGGLAGICAPAAACTP